jgi:hypothetical protein
MGRASAATLLGMPLLKLAAGVAAIVVLLSACSGGGASAGRPTTEELADAIKAGGSGLGFSEDKADCAAKVMVDSDLSDDALRRYTGDSDAKNLDDADDKAFAAALTSIEDECQVSRGAG